jgi:hypothetical protein
MEAPPGGDSDWPDTATVTARGLKLPADTTNEGWDFYLATSRDLDLATRGDFLMAMDTGQSHGCGGGEQCSG